MSDPNSRDASSDPRPTNRLARESSAYLRQHRFNPVDWYPWGDEARERAREQDRPLLVSIGYSACHWCHVMERESFEDPAIAALMNESFVNVKVDREERPDVDRIYMDVALRLHGHGGWPLNAICTPNGRPFYVGTYFPPERRHGMPSFPDVIHAVLRAWREQRNEIERNADQIAAALAARPEGGTSHRSDVDTVREAARGLMRIADHGRGGFGDAPKFPTPPSLELLVAALDFLEPREAAGVARFLRHTAIEMARRGLYDQLGGGFHRYCVDASWTIPHFEKMLYDQGQLLSFYAEIARRSHDDAELLWPIRETAAYLEREMRGEGGAFFASQDADSEGEEGRYFVWTPDEIEAVLGEESAAFCTAYGVRPSGNFENGTTQLVDEARAPRPRHAEARARLLARRQQRIPPATDRKHVAAWNGYTISGLARASTVTGDSALLEDAVRAADFVLNEMVRVKDGAEGGAEDGEPRSLLRVHDDGRAHVPGFLDDHAAMLAACLDLQRAGASDGYLGTALWLAREILERFADRETGALHLTAVDGEPLIHRPRPDPDGATPDGGGLAVLGLTRLGALSHAAEIERFVDAAIQEQGPLLEQAPHAFPTILRAVALRSRGLSVALIIGDPEAPGTVALAARARRVLRPEDAVVVVRPGGTTPTGVDPAWARGRETIDGRPTAYLCHGSRCSLPVQDPAELVADLALGTG